MVIEPRPTGSAARPAEILWLTGNVVREISLAGRVAVWEARRVQVAWAIAVVSVIAGSVIGAVLPEDRSAIAGAWEPEVVSAIAGAWETVVVLAIAVAWEVVAALAIAAASEVAAVSAIAGASAVVIASATGGWATVQGIVGVLVASAAADRAAAATVAPPA